MEQAVNLGEGCYSRHTVFHEVFHALGKGDKSNKINTGLIKHLCAVHEQYGPDRDDTIEVLLDNVIEKHRHNFNIHLNVDTAGTR